MTFASKLEKLEEEKSKLVEKRLYTITKLVERAEVLAIEDELILGALLYLKQLHDEDKNNRNNKGPKDTDNPKEGLEILKLRRLVRDKFPRRKSAK